MPTPLDIATRVCKEFKDLNFLRTNIPPNIISVYFNEEREGLGYRHKYDIGRDFNKDPKIKRFFESVTNAFTSIAFKIFNVFQLPQPQTFHEISVGNVVQLMYEARISSAVVRKFRAGNCGVLARAAAWSVRDESVEAQVIYTDGHTYLMLGNSIPQGGKEYKTIADFPDDAVIVDLWYSDKPIPVNEAKRTEFYKRSTITKITSVDTNNSLGLSSQGRPSFAETARRALDELRRNDKPLKNNVLREPWEKLIKDLDGFAEDLASYFPSGTKQSLACDHLPGPEPEKPKSKVKRRRNRQKKSQHNSRDEQVREEGQRDGLVRIPEPQPLAHVPLLEPISARGTVVDGNGFGSTGDVLRQMQCDASNGHCEASPSVDPALNAVGTVVVGAVVVWGIYNLWHWCKSPSEEQLDCIRELRDKFNNNVTRTKSHPNYRTLKAALSEIEKDFKTLNFEPTSSRAAKQVISDLEEYIEELAGLTKGLASVSARKT